MMKKFKKLNYITYQTFPADTANSIQTIGFIKYCVRLGFDVTLLFPERSNTSNGDITVLQNYYSFKENFKIQLIKHNYPFKDYIKKTHFKKFRFHISHMLWSLNTIKNLDLENAIDEVFFTRSDWVFYFLSKRSLNVVLECHQISKIRKLLLSKSMKNKNSKIIFTSSKLRDDFNLSQNELLNSIVLHNGYDEDLFNKKKIIKKDKQIIFVGKLSRFDDERDISFLIKCFDDIRLSEYNLLIIGGPEHVKKQLEKEVIKLKIKNVKFLGQLSRLETIKHIQESRIGVLINSKKNKHSTEHTSPLKYFEYLRGGLEVVAIDFTSHRLLPQPKIIYFYERTKDNFIENINNAYMNKNENVETEQFSLEARTKKIIEFMAR